MQPKSYSSTEHAIDRNLIDSDALQIVHRLQQAGFIAYLVGGSVRDLLVKRKPKDFDISTSARPEQIKQLFQRSCILIGRRFRLAHVRFGHKIFEVSTFRSGENDDDLIIQDNVWGTPAQDVLRRDFTMNGLFYDPAQDSVIDYVGGWEDIKAGVLKTIGEPKTRFRQDPVRMMRLLKFQARFAFAIDIQTQTAMKQCFEEIMKSSPARVLEEILRMLESGSSETFFHLMTESGMLELLFPCLTHFLEGKEGKHVYAYLNAADQVNQNNKNPLDRSILASCLIYPILESEVHAKFQKKGLTPNLGDIMNVTGSIIKGFVTASFSHFPRRLGSTMSFILAMQYRLTPLSGKRHPKPKLIRNHEFLLALQFLKIRSLVHGNLIDDYTYWKEMVRQGDHRPHPHRHSQSERRPPPQQS